MTTSELIEMLKLLPPDTPISVQQVFAVRNFRVVPAVAWVHLGSGFVRLDVYNGEQHKTYTKWGKPRYITFEASV
jgi:hypothetical protein